MYKIKEIYYTLQGEGFHSGRPAVFCRFTGCNLWSGREQDRATAQCRFCDTDFWGMDGKNGGSYELDALVSKCQEVWNHPQTPGFIVFTGGEPALQLDDQLLLAFHESGFETAVETNGTLPLPAGLDWICVSPKADVNIKITKGNELKVVYPQIENSPQQFEHLDFEHFYLQPMDNENLAQNTQKCIEYCLAHPKWKLSIQSHKVLMID